MVVNLKKKWCNMNKLIIKVMKALKLIPIYKSAYINISVTLEKDDWELFLKEHNPNIKEVCSSRTEKELFYISNIVADKQEITIYSPRYPNLNFDREACIRKCAEDRESWRVLQLHKDEMDVEARIKMIREKKEIGCYN